MRRCTFENFAVEVLALNEPPIRAAGTYRQMSQALREFASLPLRNDHPDLAMFRTIELLRRAMKTVNVKPLLANASDLTPPAIAAWIKVYPERSPARTASLLRSVSSACSYGIAAKYLDVSPFSFRRVNQWVRNDVVAPDRPRAPRYQSAEAIERLLAVVDAEAAGGGWKAGRLQALVYLLAYTGVRKEEALSLKLQDIDLAGATLEIQPRRTFRPKTRRSAAKLPLAGPLVAVLGLWLPRCGGEWVFPGVELKSAWRGGPPGYKPLDEVRAAGERAGIQGLTIASFRKTIGTLAKSWGLGQLELKALLRHSNVETQRWYDEEAVDSLRGAVAKIKFRAVAGG